MQILLWLRTAKIFAYVTCTHNTEYSYMQDLGKWRTGKIYEQNEIREDELGARSTLKQWPMWLYIHTFVYMFYIKLYIKVLTHSRSGANQLDKVLKKISAIMFNSNGLEISLNIVSNA